MSALLRLISVVCSLILLLSFAMFAADQARHGSKTTVARIAAGDDTTAPASRQGAARFPQPRGRRPPRRFPQATGRRPVAASLSLGMGTGQ